MKKSCTCPNKRKGSKEKRRKKERKKGKKKGKRGREEKGEPCEERQKMPESKTETPTPIK